MTGRLALRVGEVAEVLGVSRDAVYNLVNAGTIRSVKWGGTTLVTVHDLEEYLGVPHAGGQVDPKQFVAELANAVGLSVVERSDRRGVA